MIFKQMTSLTSSKIDVHITIISLNINILKYYHLVANINFEAVYQILMVSKLLFKGFKMTQNSFWDYSENHKEEIELSAARKGILIET